MILNEGQVGVCPATENLLYPNINSCLTVTAVFQNGVRTGAHLVLVGQDGSQNAWQNVLQQWNNITVGQGQQINEIIIAGAVAFWTNNDVMGNINFPGVQITQHNSEDVGQTVDITISPGGGTVIHSNSAQLV